jgi:hypothetical protein
MFTWTVRVKSINCTGFSNKKKLFTKVNSATVEACCTVHWTVQHGAAIRSSSYLLSFSIRLKRKISWDPWTVTYIFFVTEYCCICVLSKTQMQLLRQTLSMSCVSLPNPTSSSSSIFLPYILTVFKFFLSQYSNHILL